MSPTGFTYYGWNDSFPRVSGDELTAPARTPVSIEFSPRERG